MAGLNNEPNVCGVSVDKKLDFRLSYTNHKFKGTSLLLSFHSAFVIHSQMHLNRKSVLYCHSCVFVMTDEMKNKWPMGMYLNAI